MADWTRFGRRRLRRMWLWLLALLGLAAGVAWQSLMWPRSPDTTQSAVAGGEVQRTDPTTAFEPTDWDIAPIGMLYVGILALLALCSFVLIAAYPNTLPDVDRMPRSTPPQPRLQVAPRAELERFRAEEQRRLEGYYWIDKQSGTVHIPIEQAMKKLAHSGLPGSPKGPQ